MPSMQRVFGSLLILGLSACASIPLTTIYNLWNVDPWTSDFREWRAGARLPTAAGPLRIKMTVETWHDLDTQRTEDIYVLLPTTDPMDLGPLAAQRRTGYSVSAYRIDPADFNRLEALRARILASKKSPGPRLHGELQISACSRYVADKIPPGPFLVSTYFTVDRKVGYSPLVVDYDLSDVLKKTQVTDKKTGGDDCS